MALAQQHCPAKIQHMKPLRTFDLTYPGVKDILVQHKADEDLIPDDTYSRPGSLRNVWEYGDSTKHKCSSSACWSSPRERGYFDLSEAIQRALGEPSGICETSLVCNGYKGKPRGPRRNVPRCRNRVKFKITVVR